MIRILFYGLIILLIVRMINRAFRGQPNAPKSQDVPRQAEQKKTKKVNKDVGEYVDYEEIK